MPRLPAVLAVVLPLAALGAAAPRALPAVSALGAFRALPRSWAPPALRPVPRAAPLASVSLGAPNRGRLLNAAELPLEGAHWRSIRPEIRRNFGTSELVDGLRWSAERLRVNDPATPLLALGDLAAQEGGRVPRHASHQNGRDADVNFFWTDQAGAPLFSERMTSFDAKGRGRYAGREVRFDAARNWKLVVAFLSNPYFGRDVRWIFVSRGLRAVLLREAVLVGAAPELMARAARVLAQPPGASHRNHFHVRIACGARDRALGCRD